MNQGTQGTCEPMPTLDEFLERKLRDAVGDHAVSISNLRSDVEMLKGEVGIGTSRALPDEHRPLVEYCQHLSVDIAKLDRELAETRRRLDDALCIIEGLKIRIDEDAERKGIEGPAFRTPADTVSRSGTLAQILCITMSGAKAVEDFDDWNSLARHLLSIRRAVIGGQYLYSEMKSSGLVKGNRNLDWVDLPEDLRGMYSGMATDIQIYRKAVGVDA